MRWYPDSKFKPNRLIINYKSEIQIWAIFYNAK